MISNAQNITIVAPSNHWSRIKKAIKKKQRIILRDCGDYFVPTNIHDLRHKDGSTHTNLFNYKWGVKPPNEITLTGKTVGIVFKGEEYQKEVATVTLLQHATETI
jgi:hypothetical protein